MLDCVEESRQDWHASYLQQKAIERVGWKCLRVDVLTFLADVRSTLDWVEKFLLTAGVQPALKICDEVDDDVEEDLEDYDASKAREEEVVDIDAAVALEQERQNAARRAADPPDAIHAGAEDEVMLISSDEECTKAPAVPDPVLSDFRATFDTGHDQVDPSNFGYVVDLDFLRCGDESSFTDMSILLDDHKTDMASQASPRVSSRLSKRRRRRTTNEESDAEHSIEAKESAQDEDWTVDNEDKQGYQTRARLGPKRQRQQKLAADEESSSNAEPPQHAHTSS
jgi:hypothetical protein